MTIAAYRLSENCACTRTNRVKLFAVCGRTTATTRQSGSREFFCSLRVKVGSDWMRFQRPVESGPAGDATNKYNERRDVSIFIVSLNLSPIFPPLFFIFVYNDELLSLYFRFISIFISFFLLFSIFFLFISFQQIRRSYHEFLLTRPSSKSRHRSFSIMELAYLNEVPERDINPESGKLCWPLTNNR